MWDSNSFGLKFFYGTFKIFIRKKKPNFISYVSNFSSTCQICIFTNNFFFFFGIYIVFWRKKSLMPIKIIYND